MQYTTEYNTAFALKLDSLSDFRRVFFNQGYASDSFLTFEYPKLQVHYAGDVRTDMIVVLAVGDTVSRERSISDSRSVDTEGAKQLDMFAARFGASGTPDWMGWELIS